MKNCVICNTLFEGNYRAKYCSPSCRYQSRKEYKAKWNVGKEDEMKRYWKERHAKKMQDPAYREKRRLASKKRRENHPVMVDCEECGKEFRRFRYQRYCSQDCSIDAKERKQTAWQSNNKDHINKCRRINRQRPEVKAKERAYAREYNSRPEVREREREYQRARLNTPMGKLNNRIRSGVRQSLRGNKSQNTYDALGYTKDDLVLHLESQFTDGMSWDNMSDWHIDHIRPVTSFNFTTTDCEGFKKCWALSNLQPLWAFDNMSKGNKWDGEVNA